MDRLNSPPGFKVIFDPSDKDLIKNYLSPWLLCERLPCDIVIEANLYEGSHPEEFTARYDLKYGVAWYFFTPLTMRYPKGKRPKRTTEAGKWITNQPSKNVQDGEEIIGVKKTLTFYEFTETQGKVVNSNWIMNEYTINGDNFTAVRDGNWALCKLYKKHAGEGLIDDSKKAPKKVLEKKKDPKKNLSTPMICHGPSSWPPEPEKGIEVQQLEVGSSTQWTYENRRVEELQQNVPSTHSTTHQTEAMAAFPRDGGGLSPVDFNFDDLLDLLEQ